MIPPNAATAVVSGVENDVEPATVKDGVPSEFTLIAFADVTVLVPSVTLNENCVVAPEPFAGSKVTLSRNVVRFAPDPESL